MVSCAKVRVSHDYVQGFDFSKIKTFGWEATKPQTDTSLEQDNELLSKRFRSSIEDNFLRRGLTQTEPVGIHIGYTYTVTEKLESLPVQSFYMSRPMKRGSSIGGAFSNSAGIRQYSLGMLVITIHSTAKSPHQLIWRGVGTTEVFTHSSHEELDSMVTDLVDSVLTQFPPI